MQGRFGMVLLDRLEAVQAAEYFEQLAKMSSNAHGGRRLIAKITSSRPSFCSSHSLNWLSRIRHCPPDFEGQKFRWRIIRCSVHVET